MLDHTAAIVVAQVCSKRREQRCSEVRLVKANAGGKRKFTHWVACDVEST
jgi:hypothetical protein